MSPHIKSFDRVPAASIGIPLLVCLLTAAFLSVSAAVGKSDDPARGDAAFQKSLEGSRHIKFKSSAPKARHASQKDSCLEYGHHSEDYPITLNPLEHGCTPKNRGDAATPDWAIKDDLNPYSSAEEELRAYQSLVKKVMDEGQDIREGPVHKKRLIRAGGAKTPDDLMLDKEHKPWGDFVDLVVDEHGGAGQLTLITARAYLDPSDSSHAIVERRFFLVGTQGHLDLVTKTPYWYDRIDLGSNPKYFWFYHQLLRSWLQPQSGSTPKQTH